MSDRLLGFRGGRLFGRPRLPSPSASSPSGASPSAASSAASPAPSASRSSAVGAATTLTTSVSGSEISETPSGSVIAPAVNCVPMSAPSTDTVRFSGMDCTSASIVMVFASWVTSVPGVASPSTRTLTSTVTFSPRRTTSRSACWMLRRIGCSVSALVSASCSLPSMSRVSTALVPEWRSTAAKSWALSSRCWGRCRGRRGRRAPCRCGGRGATRPCRFPCESAAARLLRRVLGHRVLLLCRVSSTARAQPLKRFASITVAGPPSP